MTNAITFQEKLCNRWSDVNSLLCVGLDPDQSKLPATIQKEKKPFFTFAKHIIDATADIVCAYKPQIAFYAACAAEDQLQETIHYIKTQHPQIPVILDSKRGDIGNTAALYAEEGFGRFGADAITINPYLGYDAIEPFLSNPSKGAFLLCRTSNPGARDIQDLFVAPNERLYQHIAYKAAHEWNKNKNLMLVVGATYPKELAEIRAITGDMPMLVPGIGAQGGSIEAAVTNGKTSDGTGMIINSSRQILFASNGTDFAEAARKVAISTRDEINRFR